MVADLPIVSYQDEDGAWIAEAPTLKGVHSCGTTQEDALKYLQEALDLYFEESNELPHTSNISFSVFHIDAETKTRAGKEDYQVA